MPDRSTARRVRRALLLVLALGVVVWFALAVRALLVARTEAQAGLDAVDAAKLELNPQDFLRGIGKDRLEVARAHFAKAHDAVDTPWFKPIEVLPFIGRQMRSVEGLSGGAARVLDVGIEALTDARSAVDSAHQPQGPQRIALVRSLGRIAHDASHALDGVSIGPSKALIGPLQHAHDRFAKQLASLRRDVSGLADASDGFASFLTRSRYLVLAANNSEMRVGTGAFLSVGEMTTDEGSLHLAHMQSVIDLAPRKGAVQPASVDPDIAARWGFMHPADDFREVAVTGRYDAVAPLALKMWQARTGHALDGVLVLDPIALRGLLDAVGPVTVDGVTYTKDNVLEQIYLEQYRGDGFFLSDPANAARRERLSGVARAAIDRLERGGWDAARLVDALRSATLGRHILMYSARPVEERGWVGARLDGGIPSDGLMLAVHNRAGNKLDQFLTTTATVHTNVVADGSSQCTVDADIVNRTRLDQQLPGYVVGPYPGTPGAAAGRYIGWVVFELPRDATDSHIDVDGTGVAQLVAAGRDGPDHRVVAALVRWDPGQRHVVSVHFTLPKGERSFEVQPTGRVSNPSLGVPAVVWRDGATTYGDDLRHTLDW